ncbi:hypothetical protein ACFH04_02480 [Streptomyces noboritoensis]|uniref:Secreted protein n=1 Tax=Streptomyces noboritoensis TaxID=67337 RepID=A0ABV6T9Z3_9ACTN
MLSRWLVPLRHTLCGVSGGPCRMSPASHLRLGAPGQAPDGTDKNTGDSLTLHPCSRDGWAFHHADDRLW